MGQQHPQRYPALLVDQIRLAILIHILEDADLLQLWADFLELVSIVESPMALLNKVAWQLCRISFSYMMRSRRLIKGHGCLRVETTISVWVFGESLPILVNSHRDAS